MDDSVRIEIEVTPEAASLLQDETRRRSVGRMVSELVGRKQLDRHPLRRLFAEIKNDARADGLSDRAIEAELKRHRAERRRRREHGRQRRAEGAIDSRNGTALRAYL
jgi:hypothetical protein